MRLFSFHKGIRRVNINRKDLEMFSLFFLLFFMQFAIFIQDSGNRGLYYEEHNYDGYFHSRDFRSENFSEILKVRLSLSDKVFYFNHIIGRFLMMVYGGK